MFERRAADGGIAAFKAALSEPVDWRTVTAVRIVNVGVSRECTFGGDLGAQFGIGTVIPAIGQRVPKTYDDAKALSDSYSAKLSTLQAYLASSTPAQDTAQGTWAAIAFDVNSLAARLASAQSYIGNLVPGQTYDDVYQAIYKSFHDTPAAPDGTMPAYDDADELTTEIAAGDSPRAQSPGFGDEGFISDDRAMRTGVDPKKAIETVVAVGVLGVALEVAAVGLVGYGLFKLASRGHNAY